MKRTVIAIAAALMAAVMPVNAYAGTTSSTTTYTTNCVNKTEYVTQDEYEMFINTLRGMQDAQDNGDYYLRDTGIVRDNIADAYAVKGSLEKLFMGDINTVAIVVNRGYDYAVMDQNPNENGSYSCTSYGSNSGNYGHIYVAFRPGTDGSELMRQHDAAKAVIDAAVAAAPEGTLDKYRYFNDWIANVNSYDHVGYESGINTKYSVYNAVCEGSSVCEGYARTFFNLCFQAGIPTAYVSCKVPKDDGTSAGHAMNAVNVDGTWKEIDTCWNDTDYGVRYTYYMLELNDEWQNTMNAPYCTVA